MLGVVGHATRGATPHYSRLKHLRASDKSDVALALVNRIARSIQHRRSSQLIGERGSEDGTTSSRTSIGAERQQFLSYPAFD
jgi:hypothetical protein